MAVGTIEEWKVQAYSNNVHHLAQAMKNRLFGTTRFEQANAQSFGFRRLGPSEGREGFARLAPIVHVVEDHSDRVAFAAPWAYNAIVDSFEKAEQIYEPNNEYVISGAAAYNRMRDRRIINAALGPAVQRVGGPEGTITTVAFDDTNQRIVHGSSGNTVDKILQARAMLGDATNEEMETFGPYYFVYRPLDIRWMFADVQTTSKDFVPVQALMSGTPVQGFLGFTWIPSTQLPMVTTIRTNIAYAKSALGFFTNLGGKKERMSERNDLEGHPMQASLFDEFGVVRIDDKLVVAIEVDTAATPT